MTITLPLSITIPRKTKEDKVFVLNLNTYRNTHFHILNDAKERWKGIVTAAWSYGMAHPITPCTFTYTVFPANNRAFDVANVCSVIDKFTCDALVEMGVIPDDNHKIIKEIRYQIGKVDKENPRCELKIEQMGGCE